MVLDIPGGLFGEQREGIPKEARASLERENSAMSIIVPGNYTTYWTCPGTGFTSNDPNSDDVQINVTYNTIKAQVNGIYFGCPVFLPHGAVVTAVICYGSDAAETWTLSRALLTASTTAVAMASANFNTEDTAIDNATIDNSAYVYWIKTSPFEINDVVKGARITYTISRPSVSGTGFVVATTAYSGAGQKLKGFVGTFSINNHVGSQQTYNWNIANTTKGTTLESAVGLVLANGTYRTTSFPWSTNEVSHGDVITFTITSGALGTAGSSNYLGYCSFKVNSIEETDVAT